MLEVFAIKQWTCIVEVCVVYASVCVHVCASVWSQAVGLHFRSLYRCAWGFCLYMTNLVSCVTEVTRTQAIALASVIHPSL